MNCENSAGGSRWVVLEICHECRVKRFCNQGEDSCYWVLESISKNSPQNVKRVKEALQEPNTLCPGQGRPFSFICWKPITYSHQASVLPLNLACHTSCREIWACSSWMLLVATGLSSISLWAPSMSSWRCCISCSYCSYCTTASFERKKKKDNYLSMSITV